MVATTMNSYPQPTTTSYRHRQSTPSYDKTSYGQTERCAPVSYTHLDVYKRQLLILQIISGHSG